MGLWLGKAVLQRYVNLIELFLLTDKRAAAGVALDMYTEMARLGPKLPARHMKHWLAGTAKDLPISSSDVKGAMLDDDSSTEQGRGVSKGSPQQQLTDQICKLVKNIYCSTGTIQKQKKPFELRATIGDYKHAFGAFKITFSGDYDCDDGCCTFDGTWELTDKYNWHKGSIVKMYGVIIKDDYAKLVEKHGKARPFDMKGTYKAEIELDCEPDSCGHAGLVFAFLLIPLVMSRGARRPKRPCQSSGPDEKANSA